MKYVVTRTNYWAPEEDFECPHTKKEKIIQSGEEVEYYTIELNSLEELNQLSKEVGHPIIVFEESPWGFELPELEIYDGYRE